MSNQVEKICIVGAGFSGAVIARELAEHGYLCVVIDERLHLAGNCHTERDTETGIMVHKYGPHIFHTADQGVWDYVRKYGTFKPYVNRVKANVKGKVYSLPINLHTINQFFNLAMSPVEAKEFIQQLACTVIANPQSFEEQGMKYVGKALYMAFFDGYTRKQWGVEPSILPASILKRLPIRFNYDDNYFNHPYQGMPENGYTDVISNILNHDKIEVRLGCSFEDFTNEATHTFYSGPLDRFYNFEQGRLSYRTLDFEMIRAEGDFQGTAVMNYPDSNIPFTRISEHKHFAPWESDKFDKTIAFREFSRSCEVGDIPYYPIRQLDDKQLLDVYEKRAQSETNVTFVGRLGTYQYLDMDVVIRRALDCAADFLKKRAPEGRNPR
jgi:UDP-galactopyranose mutase